MPRLPPEEVEKRKAFVFHFFKERPGLLGPEAIKKAQDAIKAQTGMGMGLDLVKEQFDKVHTGKIVASPYPSPAPSTPAPVTSDPIPDQTSSIRMLKATLEQQHQLVEELKAEIQGLRKALRVYKDRDGAVLSLGKLNIIDISETGMSKIEEETLTKALLSGA